MQSIEKWKGLCRNCGEIRVCYFDILNGALCSECGTSIADPWIERS